MPFDGIIKTNTSLVHTPANAAQINPTYSSLGRNISLPSQETLDLFKKNLTKQVANARQQQQQTQRQPTQQVLLPNCLQAPGPFHNVSKDKNDTN